MTSATLLQIASIVRDPAVQVRRKIDQPTVERYAEDWALLPPVTVFRLPDGRAMLVDGWHRLAAADLLGVEAVQAIVRQGDYVAACDEAARANMASGRQLTKEERHEAIVRTYERHKPITQRDLGYLLGISQKTVNRALTIEGVKADVGLLSNITQPSAEAARAPQSQVMPAEYWDADHMAWVEPAIPTEQERAPRRPGRPKQPLKDDHLVELGAAPPDERKPLAEATVERGWSPRETREAVREVADPATPPERKEQLRRGQADPLRRTPEGEPEALPETFARAMAEPAGNTVYSRYKDAAGILAELATIPDVGAEAIAGLPAADLAALAHDPLRIPRYIGVLEAIREAAQRALRPSLQEVK